jgi:hypothetical protein
MFNFGSTEDNVLLFKEAALRVDGPRVPEMPMEELTHKQLPIAMTYARIAYNMAIEEGADAAVCNVLLEDYDAMFTRLCKISDQFLDAVRENKHRYVNEHVPGSREKYRRLAGLD